MPPTESASTSQRLVLRVVHDFAGLPPAAYCSLLGTYLGDGCISRARRVWRLRIALDALDIPWTRSSKKIVSIYRKSATGRLDTFIGPKTRAVPLNGVHYTA